MLNIETTILDLEKRVELVRSDIVAERAMGVPDREQLQAEHAQALIYANKAITAAEAGKAEAKRRKKEIDDWKDWYNNLPEEEKEVGLAKLQSEIAWRAAELERLTPKITELLINQANAQGALEVAQQRLSAFEAGIYERPVEEDPRLIAVSNALQERRTVAKNGLHTA